MEIIDLQSQLQLPWSVFPQFLPSTKPVQSEAVSKLNFSVSWWGRFLPIVILIYQQPYISKCNPPWHNPAMTFSKIDCWFRRRDLPFSVGVCLFSKGKLLFFRSGYWSTFFHWLSRAGGFDGFSWGGHCLSLVRTYVERSASKAKWPVFRSAFMMFHVVMCRPCSKNEKKYMTAVHFAHVILE